jgi:hypothetical protein
MYWGHVNTYCEPVIMSCAHVNMYWELVTMSWASSAVSDEPLTCPDRCVLYPEILLACLGSINNDLRACSVATAYAYMRITSEFEGIDEDDLPLARLLEHQDVGSDISMASDSDSDSTSSDSDSDSEGEIERWGHNLRAPNNEPFTQRVGATFDLAAEAREIDFFLKFFPDELIDLLVKETNEYAERCILQKPDKLWKPVTSREIKACLGIHVIMSVIQVPSYSVLWTQKWPFSIPSVPEIMQRTRYEKISKYFHCNNVDTKPPRRQPGHDKLCHVRPVIDKIVSLCLSNYDPPMEQSVDEGMIAFKGRLSFKQYLPAKPTKFGIKVWARAAPLNGYCHEFQVYTGKQDQVGNQRSEEGLGARVIKDMTRNIFGKGHHIYMDNYFSSPVLFEDLYKVKTYACGTVRGNRKGLPETIKSCKFKDRGEYKIMQKDNLCAWAWRDQKTVYYLSTNCDPTVENTV